ncbi:hypothetical protein HY837_01175 [archaeon]|nr:hypothetical protein [archaeon]
MNQTFISSIVHEAPFVIANGQLYQISDLVEGKDFIRSGNINLGLIPSANLAEIELFELNSRSKEIFNYKKRYIEEELDKEFISKSDIKSKENVTTALNFILNEFLPLMIDTSYEVGDLLGVDLKGNKTGKQIIDNIVKNETQIGQGKDLEQDVAKMRKIIEAKQAKGPTPLFPAEKKEEEKTVLGKITDFLTGKEKTENPNHSVLGEMIQNVSLYFSKGQVYKLQPAKETEGVTFVINGKNYSLLHFSDLAYFENQYLEQFRRVLQNQALTEFDKQFQKVLEGIANKRNGFDEFMKKNQFSYGNLGYVRSEDSFYVYWEVPKFAMQNPVKTNMCNPYSPAKVAVRVQASNGAIYLGDHEYIIDKMIHPTLRNWDKQFCDICHLDRKRRGTSAKDAMANLSDGINSFTNGLTQESLRAHGDLSEDAAFFGVSLKKVFEKTGYLSIEDALAQGYRITNVWDVDAFQKELDKYKEKYQNKKLAGALAEAKVGAKA